MNHAFTADDIAQHLRGLQDSVTTIDAIIAAGERTDEALAAADRNMRHIHIMCAMPQLQECGADLKPYTDAAARGAAWLAQN
jgi:hypothetical protein